MHELSRRDQPAVASRQRGGGGGGQWRQRDGGGGADTEAERAEVDDGIVNDGGAVGQVETGSAKAPA